MTFEEYQIASGKTATYAHTERGVGFFYPVLGLMGEAGEVAEKFKKLWRDHDNVLDETAKIEIGKELGDVLWYIAQIAREIGLPLEEVATLNLEKIQSRVVRGTIHGDGDNR